jgi:hypothetical protein
VGLVVVLVSGVLLQAEKSPSEKSPRNNLTSVPRSMGVKASEAVIKKRESAGRFEGSARAVVVIPREARAGAVG